MTRAGKSSGWSWYECGGACCDRGGAETIDAHEPPDVVKNQAFLGKQPAGTTANELVEMGAIDIEAGATYRGQWLGAKRHGYGRLMWSDSSFFEGNFVDSMAHGFGRFTTASGNYYEGQWEQDRAHGKGKYVFNDGSTYEGDWVYDEKHGVGVESWPDGSMYEGQFEHGIKHGYGTYIAATGMVTYQGQFCNDKMHGEGIYNFANGRAYEGQWVGGQMDGFGTMRWADGSKYEGMYSRDVRHGEGTLIWPDGRMYCGQWVNGKQDGSGVMVDAQGVRKPGNWSMGNPIELEIDRNKIEDWPSSMHNQAHANQLLTSIDLSPHEADGARIERRYRYEAEGGLVMDGENDEFPQGPGPPQAQKNESIQTMMAL